MARVPTIRSPAAGPRPRVAAVSATPMVAIDYHRASSDVAQAVFNVARNTLQKWIGDGAPVIKEKGKAWWDIPKLIEWRREKDVETATEKMRRTAGTRADMETAVESLSDQELARRALREEMMVGAGIAKIQAAKAVLGIVEKGPDDGDGIDAVGFIEIHNVAGVIEACGVSTPCPKCGHLVHVGKPSTS